MTDTVTQIHLQQSWLVMSIGSYDLETKTQPMIWEGIFYAETEAIEVASKIGLAFVMPSTEVSYRLVRSPKV